MSKRVLLGMLTPSSNTVLEPLTCAILAGTPDVTAHFGRFRVTEISLSAAALGQFDNAPLIDASRLLVDARVDVIAWNGTSGGWLGFDADRALCREIAAATGTLATTSTLALADAFDAVGARRYALVTPYLDEIQTKIVANFDAEGYHCVAERHLNDKGNFSFSEFSEEVIESMVREAAEAKPEAIAIYCTNFRGARVAARLEDELGVPIIDSVSVTVWRAMLMAGADPSRIDDWGRLFEYGLVEETAAGAGRGLQPST